MKLVIDGNAVINYIYRIVLHELSNRPGRIFDYELNENNEKIKVLSLQSIDYYEDFLLKFIKNIIYPFKNANNIIIVFDYPKYWRKHYLEWYFKKEENSNKQFFEYKERPDTQEQKEKIENIGAFFKYTHEKIVNDLVQIKGISIVRQQGAEGDDLIAMICEKYDEDIVIWSVDTDLVQLLSDKPNRSRVLITPKQNNNPRKIFLPEEKLNESMDFIDLLGSQSDFNHSIIDIAKSLAVGKNEYNVFTVNPDKVIFTKILAGDKGSDNIPSVYTWKSQTGNKTMSLTEKVATEIINELSINYEISKMIDLIRTNDEPFTNQLLDKIFEKHKNLNINDKVKRKEILENIHLNIKLIKLDSISIPKSLYEKINHLLDTNIINDKRFIFEIFENKVNNPIKNI